MILPIILKKIQLGSKVNRLCEWLFEINNDPLYDSDGNQLTCLKN